MISRNPIIFEKMVSSNSKERFYYKNKTKLFKVVRSRKLDLRQK